MPAVKAKKRPRVGPGRLSAEASEALPDRLMDAAFSQFTEFGFEGATMDQIAKRAGASTKTLYSRFANKSEILEAVVRRNVQRTVADHLRGFALRPEESEPREFLTKFAMQIGSANQADETAGLVRVTFAESHRYPVLGRMYREVTGRGIDALTRAFTIWRDAGVMAFDEEPHHLANLCWGMLTHEMRVQAIMGNPMSRREIQRYVDTGVAMFLNYVAPDAQKKRARK